MNKILLLLFLALSVITYAQENKPDEVILPDTEFKGYCLRHYDTNKDGILTRREVAQIKEAHIKSLEGMESFLNLETLVVSTRDTIKFDGRLFKNLKVLHLYCRNLEDVNLSSNDQLKVLTISTNQIQTINLKKNKSLQKLDLSMPKVQKLDLNNNVQLRELSLSEMTLQALHTHKLRELEKLYLWSVNTGEALELSRNSNLQYITLKKCNLRNINLAHQPKLIALNCGENELTEINLSQNPNLKTLNLPSNHIAAIDLSANKVLQQIQLRNNRLTMISLKENTELEEVDLGNNLLTQLDCSTNVELTNLSCQQNKLISLIVDHSPLLTNLNCSHNLLTSINLDNNHALTKLKSYKNKGIIKLPADQAIERLTNNFKTINNSDLYLLVPFTKGSEWGMLDSRTLQPIIDPWLLEIGFFNPDNRCEITNNLAFNLKPTNDQITIKAIIQSPIYEIGFAPEEDRLPEVTDSKGFVVDENGKLISYSSIYDKQKHRPFNEIPFQYKNKYYALATLKHTDYHTVIIDEKGNYAPAFNQIYKSMERCFYVTKEREAWFFCREIGGNTYFQNMEGEKRFENIFLCHLGDTNLSQYDALFGYVIVTTENKKGVFDLTNLEWVIAPQTLLDLKKLDYASPYKLDNLPKNRDKVLIYILVKDNEGKMYYIDLDQKRYVHE